MRHWKAITGIILVFLLGASAGVLGTHMVYERRIEGVLQRGPQAASEAIVKRLSKKLDLDGIQRAQLQVIVADSWRDWTEVRKMVQPRISAIAGQVEGKVRAILRPEQVTTFDRIVVERRKIEERAWSQEQNKTR
jgi:hypothetical protein